MHKVEVKGILSAKKALEGNDTESQSETRVDS